MNTGNMLTCKTAYLLTMLERGSKMKTNQSCPSERSFVGVVRIPEIHKKTISTGITFRVATLSRLKERQKVGQSVGAGRVSAYLLAISVPF